MADDLDPNTSLPDVAGDAAATVRGVRHLALIMLALFAAAALTYAVPFLERFRPWLEGDALPVVGLFASASKEQLPEFAEAAAPSLSSEQERARLSATLGETVVANLGDDADDSEPTPSRSAGGPPLVRVDPSELQGLPRSLEHAEHLDPFYEALYETAKGEAPAITRIAHYGDSAVAADGIASTMRRSMQRRFGDAGHGFMLVARGDMHYSHKNVRHRSSDGWQIFSIVRRSLGKDWYGYGGVQFRATRGPYAWFGTTEEGRLGRHFSRFEVFFQRHRRGGKLRVVVDGEQSHVIDTRSDRQQDAWRTFHVPDGEHSVSLKALGRGAVHLYGVAMERDVAGVVYDSLGLVGARAQRLLAAESDHMARQLEHRDPDLIVLGFGGNEAANDWLDIERYEKSLVKVVRLMRGDSGFPCLLLAPLDQAERDERGRVRTVPMLPEIVDTQRRVAGAEGCAFFDVYQAMGGEGSMRRWYRSRPRLATGDFKHATPEGYQVIGRMFYKALLEGFKRFLEDERPGD